MSSARSPAIPTNKPATNATATISAALVLLDTERVSDVRGGCSRHGFNGRRLLLRPVDPLDAERGDDRQHRERSRNRTEPARERLSDAGLHANAGGHPRLQTRPQGIVGRFVAQLLCVIAETFEEFFVSHGCPRISLRVAVSVCSERATSASERFLR